MKGIYGLRLFLFLVTWTLDFNQTLDDLRLKLHGKAQLPGLCLMPFPDSLLQREATFPIWKMRLIRATLRLISALQRSHGLPYLLRELRRLFSTEAENLPNNSSSDQLLQTSLSGMPFYAFWFFVFSLSFFRSLHTCQ